MPSGPVFGKKLVIPFNIKNYQKGEKAFDEAKTCFV
jgi:hypothetical protein